MRSSVHHRLAVVIETDQRDLRRLRRGQGIEIVEINPADAAKRGISEGDELRIWNARGEVHLAARITDAVLPGVVYSPKGAWLATSPTGQTVNSLISSDIRTDIENGACYNETFVDVARVA